MCCFVLFSTCQAMVIQNWWRKLMEKKAEKKEEKKEEKKVAKKDSSNT